MSCIENQTIPLNAFDPYVLRVRITDSDVNQGDFTLLDVQDLDFSLRKPDESEVTFTPVLIEEQTAELIVATYTLQTGDLDQCGGWSVAPVMNTGGPSSVYGTRRPFTVAPV